MAWTDLLGHDEPLVRLRAGVARNRLAHAYAFVGPAGIGKMRFALELAKCLLCERHTDAELQACGECRSCRQVAARTHPDLLLTGLPEGKSELPISLFVGEDESRGREGLCFELSLRPMSGRRRVAIINDAETLNEASGNCLLKTLEEPPPDSLLILVATSADALLPTIRSRCQVLTFQPLSEEQVQTILVREGLVAGEAEAAEVARWSQGSLATAKQLLDPEVRALRGELFELLAGDPFPAAQLAAKAVAAVDAAGSEKPVQRATAGWIVTFCVEFYRRALWLLTGTASGETDFPQVGRFLSRIKERSLAEIDRLGNLLDRCLRAGPQFDANAVVPLCLETLFHDLGAIQRAPATVSRGVLQQLESWQRAGLAFVPRASAAHAPAAPVAAIAPAAAIRATPAKGLFDGPPSPGTARVLTRDDRVAALKLLAAQVAQCRRCTNLAETRTQTVFGVGNPEAKIVFIGEAPGADEDRQGEPFVGRAGKLLNDIIAACRLKREDVYICNILKCRPPENRTPQPDECGNCREFLLGQLQSIDPQYIVCWGSVAAQNLLGSPLSIGKLRGKFHQYGRAKVLCTYHPSYLLRNPAAKKDVWDDMKFLFADMGVDLGGKRG